MKLIGRELTEEIDRLIQARIERMKTTYLFKCHGAWSPLWIGHEHEKSFYDRGTTLFGQSEARDEFFNLCLTGKLVVVMISNCKITMGVRP